MKICQHKFVVVTRIDDRACAYLRCMNPGCHAEDRVHVALLPIAAAGTVYTKSDWQPADPLRTNLVHFSGYVRPWELDFETGRVRNPPLSFFADGIPAPQGSKRHVGNGILVESSKKVKPWRQAVTASAGDAAANNWAFMESGAVRIDIVFWLPAPRSVKRLFPSVKPDGDKLVRSTYDGIVIAGNIIKDDAQIVDGTALKRYALPGMLLGADILISALE